MTDRIALSNMCEITSFETRSAVSDKAPVAEPERAASTGTSSGASNASTNHVDSKPRTTRSTVNCSGYCRVR